MALMRFNGFFGERPGRHPQQLDIREGQYTRNCRVLSQSLEPFRARLVTRAVDSGLAPRTLFRDRAGLWLEFSQRTAVVNSIIGNDEHDRVFYTNLGGPRVSDGARRTSGTGPFPGASLRLGVPVITDAITATVVFIGDADPNDGSQPSLQNRAYTVTLENTFGEEGPPSASSNVVEVYPGGEISVSLPDPPVGDYDLRHYFIYRNTDGLWQYVGKELITATSFTDKDNVAEEMLESSDWYEPPMDLRGLTAVAGSFLVGYRENEVLFSEFGLPHAWPFAYRQPVPHTVKGVGTFGNAVVVLTDGPVYVASGGSPTAMSLAETGLHQSCVAEESIVSMANSVVYASPDGLVRVSASVSGVVTNGVFTDREWRRLNPSTIRAAHWMGVYVASFDGEDGPGAFLFDPSNPDVGVFFLDLPRLTAVYNFVEEDKLYMLDELSTEVVEWDADPNAFFADAVWRSRPVSQPPRVPIKVVRVRADSYPVTVRVYADGATQAEVVAAHGRPIRIGGARLATTYSVEAQTPGGRVHEVVASTTVAEAKGV